MPELEEEHGAGATGEVLTMMPRGPSRRNWREVVELCCQPYNLRTTVVVALVVGTVLFAINQLDVVVARHADGGTVAKIALTYLVPFAVSNYGIVHGTKRRHRDGSKQASLPSRK